MKATFLKARYPKIMNLLLALAIVLTLNACSKEQTEKDTVHVNALNDSTSEQSDNKNGSVEAQKNRALEQESNVSVSPLKNAYFGETHLHTMYSLDAYIGGNRMSPKDSLQFAQGQEKTINGKPQQLQRPLDFAATTDHAEYIGEMYTTFDEQATGHNNPQLNDLRNLSDYSKQLQWFIKYVIKSNRGSTPQHPPFYTGEKSTKSAWQVILAATKNEYKPGVFTTLAAFEWSGAPNGANLHRNILFRDMVVPESPVSYIDINREEELWDWMTQQEKNGSTLLAIPHNSNASKLNMFNPNDSTGEPITKEYAQTRSHFERLIEMMQIKGNSEVHRKLWPADEFANFENADSIKKYSKRDLDKRNFVRWGSIEGLKHYQKLGVNPYKYGYSGGTDNHNGTMGDVAEDNYIGSHGAADKTVTLRRTGVIPQWIDGKDVTTGSLTGVWAIKNTRGAIWDAMFNRETYVTSGPRIQVRLFAGEHLSTDHQDVKAMVKEGYKKGVPMGGTIIGAKSASIFNVWAVKDNIGANLDRIQIIKGWVDEQGQQHEKIINVSWSDNRQVNEQGKLAKVGNTVDLVTAKYTNSIGSAMLMGSFFDEEFNSDLPTLYYARVIEIPTPRWSTYDAVRVNLPLLTDVAATIQERAWSSPIWFMPVNEQVN